MEGRGEDLMVNEQIPPWMRQQQSQQVPQQQQRPVQQQGQNQGYYPAPNVGIGGASVQQQRPVQQQPMQQQYRPPQQQYVPQKSQAQIDAEFAAIKKRKRIVYGLGATAVILSILFIISVIIFIMRYK
jgi:hypothetical protein